MSDLAVSISGFVVGDDLEIRRTVTDLSSAISVAWLTVKRYHGQPDLEAVIQKRITTVNVPGTGHVVTAGGPGTNGDLRFDLTGANTLALGSASWIHDIQIMLSSGKVYTIEKGTLQLTPQVTQAST